MRARTLMALMVVSGTATAGTNPIDRREAWRWIGAESDLFGLTSADLNADGALDLVVGAPRPTTLDPVGAVYVFYGGGPLSPGPDLVIGLPWDEPGEHTVFGLWADIDGDGHDDQLTREIASDGAFLLRRGRRAGLPVIDTVLDVRPAGLDAFPHHAGGDVDGDGRADVVMVAERLADPDQPLRGEFATISVHLGTDDGLSRDPVWTFDTETIGRYFGDVGIFGDVDGDGFDDIVLAGVIRETNLRWKAELRVFPGGPDGPASSATNAVVEDRPSGREEGFALASLGDSNGDDFDDVLLVVDTITAVAGGPENDFLLAFLGSSLGLQASRVAAAQPGLVTAPPGRLPSERLTRISRPADVDGNGFPDVLFTVPGLRCAFTQTPSTGCTHLLSGTAIRPDPWPSRGWRPDNPHAYGTRTAVVDLDTDDMPDVVVEFHDQRFAGLEAFNGFFDRDLDGHSPPSDCDDDNPDANPDRTEVWYDGIDQDCDGLSDYDRDLDGFEGDDDCDDNDPDTHVGAEELWYDGVDQDCDGNDDDRDGDGSAAFMAGGTDCNDDDPAIRPGAVDEPGDGVDANCDGVDGVIVVPAENGRRGCASSPSGGPGLTWLLTLPVFLWPRRRHPVGPGTPPE